MRLNGRWRPALMLTALIVFVGVITFVFMTGISTINTDGLSERVKLKLQAQLDTDYTPGLSKILSIDLIRKGDNFVGSANLLVIGKAVILPINIISSGNTTIVTASSGDLNRVQASFQDTLSNLVGKPSDFILDPRFQPLFPKELVRDKSKFKQNLETVDEIKEDSSYYYGHGCQAHRCEIAESAWAIDKKSAHLIAVVAHVDLGRGEDRKININIALYGKPKGQNDLPPPLDEWEKNLENWLDSTANSDGLLEAARGVQAAHESRPAQPSPTVTAEVGKPHRFQGNVATWNGIPQLPPSSTPYKTATNATHCSAADAANHWGSFWGTGPICQHWLAMVVAFSRQGPTPMQVHSYRVGECWKRAGMLVTPDGLQAAGQACENMISQLEYEQNKQGAAAVAAEAMQH